MSLQPLDLKSWHRRYESLSVKQRHAVNTAFNAARAKLQEALPDLPGDVDELPLDDRAEALVAAITAYYCSGEVSSDS